MPVDEQLDVANNYIIASQLPGRIRFKIRQLFKNRELARFLKKSFLKRKGVIRVDFNLITRSLLLVYDREEDNHTGIINQLEEFLIDFRSAKYETDQLLKGTASTIENDLINGHNTQGVNVELHRNYYQLSIPQTSAILNSNLKRGLSTEQADALLSRYGPNQFEKKKPPSLFARFVEQFDEFLPRLLLGASCLSAFLGHWGDAITIASIVIVESALGVWQNYKAEKSMEMLSQYSETSCKVVRDGIVKEIPSHNLVPGDLIYLEPGDLVPADARLTDSSNLKIDEAPLTGESYPVEKSHKIKYASRVALAERKNTIYMGTNVVSGTGKALILKTGMKTEMGQIANMIEDSEPDDTPLQKELNHLAKTLTLGCLGVSGGIMLISLLQGRPLLEILRSGISLAIGTVPEGLTAVLAVSLAFGVQRMAKRGAIVKKLPDVESLSCADIICTDKTGTLTQGQMTVKNIYTGGGNLYSVSGEGYQIDGEIMKEDSPIEIDGEDGLKKLLEIGTHCNNARYQVKGDRLEITGDPTEGALWVLAHKGEQSIADISHYQRVKEIPFDSESKRMITVDQGHKGFYGVNLKGAPEAILSRCDRILINKTVRKITEIDQQRIRTAVNNMADGAQRVMAFAYKNITRVGEDESHLEDNLIFVGLAGMLDPPRPEVYQAIKKCNRAGIKVVMVTGDHRKTATAIGKEVGLLNEDDLVITGEELEEMTDEQLVEKIDRIAIYARTSPGQKMRIVKVLQEKGHIVAMTGDGVNDAPAIKSADIGIAMGQNGTDVTREASSIILTDDNFATIVNAIEEGRTVSGNIKKFIRFIMAGNIGQVLAVGVAALCGMTAPLLPTQILMIDLLTEGVTSLALGVEPADESCMDQPPRDLEKGMVDGQLIKKMLRRGILMGITSFTLFTGTLFFSGNLRRARTMAYANMIISQFFHLFDCRTGSLAKNKLIVPLISSAFLLLAGSIYIPTIAAMLGTCPLGLIDWIALISMGGLISRLGIFKDKCSIVSQSGRYAPMAC